MKLDVTCMRYLTKDDYRVLVAIEMGMRNHEMVPVPLITNIAKLRHGGSFKILSTLLRYKLVAHTNLEYNGYRLSYLGYDILALKTLLTRGVIASVGNQIGVGKESDIFEAEDEHGNDVVIKIHRLGRTSFRAVRRNRDYMEGKSKASWLFMSRLAAMKEFAFMKALYAHGFPTPVPIDQSRHIVAMSKVNGSPMSQIYAGKMTDPEGVFGVCLSILRRLAEHGLVHCDFNEFNLMVDSSNNVTLIDFPQMVSTEHPNAAELLKRDVTGLIKFFAMKMHFVPPTESLFELSDVAIGEVRIDQETRASGVAADGGSAAAEGDELDLDGYEWSNNHDGEQASVGDSDSDDEGNDPDEEQRHASGVFQFGGLAAGRGKEASSITLEHLSVSGEKHLADELGGEESDTEAGTRSLQNQRMDSVKDKLKRDISRHDTSAIRKNSSRNATKKRNKYGNIVKNHKLDTSDF